MERKSILVKSQETSSSPNRLECSVCKQRFWMTSKYMDHMSSHKHLLLSCNICNKSFYNQKLLDEHYLIHNEVINTYDCAQCSRKFLQRYQLEQHMKFHPSPIQSLSSESKKKKVRFNNILESKNISDKDSSSEEYHDCAEDNNECDLSGEGLDDCDLSGEGLDDCDLSEACLDDFALEEDNKYDMLEESNDPDWEDDSKYECDWRGECKDDPDWSDGSKSKKTSDCIIKSKNMLKNKKKCVGRPKNISVKTKKVLKDKRKLKNVPKNKSVKTLNVIKDKKKKKRKNDPDYINGKKRGKKRSARIIRMKNIFKEINEKKYKNDKTSSTALAAKTTALLVNCQPSEKASNEVSKELEEKNVESSSICTSSDSRDKSVVGSDSAQDKSKCKAVLDTETNVSTINASLEKVVNKNIISDKSTINELEGGNAESSTTCTHSDLANESVCNVDSEKVKNKCLPQTPVNKKKIKYQHLRLDYLKKSKRAVVQKARNVSKKACLNQTEKSNIVGSKPTVLPSPVIKKAEAASSDTVQKSPGLQGRNVSKTASLNQIKKLNVTDFKSTVSVSQSMKISDSAALPSVNKQFLYVGPKEDLGTITNIIDKVKSMSNQVAKQHGSTGLSAAENNKNVSLANSCKLNPTNAIAKNATKRSLPVNPQYQSSTPAKVVKSDGLKFPNGILDTKIVNNFVVVKVTPQKMQEMQQKSFQSQANFKKDPSSNKTTVDLCPPSIKKKKVDTQPISIIQDGVTPVVTEKITIESDKSLHKNGETAQTKLVSAQTKILPIEVSNTDDLMDSHKHVESDESSKKINMNSESTMMQRKIPSSEIFNENVCKAGDSTIEQSELSFSDAAGNADLIQFAESNRSISENSVNQSLKLMNIETTFTAEQSEITSLKASVDTNLIHSTENFLTAEKCVTHIKEIALTAEKSVKNLNKCDPTTEESVIISNENVLTGKNSGIDTNENFLANDKSPIDSNEKNVSTTKKCIKPSNESLTTDTPVIDLNENISVAEKSAGNLNKKVWTTEKTEIYSNESNLTLQKCVNDSNESVHTTEKSLLNSNESASTTKKCVKPSNESVSSTDTTVIDSNENNLVAKKSAIKSDKNVLTTEKTVIYSNDSVVTLQKSVNDLNNSVSTTEKSIIKSNKSVPTTEKLINNSYETDVISKKSINESSENVLTTKKSVNDSNENSATAEKSILDSNESIIITEKPVTDSNKSISITGTSEKDSNKSISITEKSVKDSNESAVTAENFIIDLNESIAITEKSVMDSNKNAPASEKYVKASNESVLTAEKSVINSNESVPSTERSVSSSSIFKDSHVYSKTINTHSTCVNSNISKSSKNTAVFPILLANKIIYSTISNVNKASISNSYFVETPSKICIIQRDKNFLPVNKQDNSEIVNFAENPTCPFAPQQNIHCNVAKNTNVNLPANTKAINNNTSVLNVTSSEESTAIQHMDSLIFKNSCNMPAGSMGNKICPVTETVSAAKSILIPGIENSCAIKILPYSNAVNSSVNYVAKRSKNYAISKNCTKNISDETRTLSNADIVKSCARDCFVRLDRIPMLDQIASISFPSTVKNLHSDHAATLKKDLGIKNASPQIDKNTGQSQSTSEKTVYVAFKLPVENRIAKQNNISNITIQKPFSESKPIDLLQLKTSKKFVSVHNKNWSIFRNATTVKVTDVDQSTSKGIVKSCLSSQRKSVNQVKSTNLANTAANFSCEPNRKISNRMLQLYKSKLEEKERKKKEKYEEKKILRYMQNLCQEGIDASRKLKTKDMMNFETKKVQKNQLFSYPEKIDENESVTKKNSASKDNLAESVLSKMILAECSEERAVEKARKICLNFEKSLNETECLSYLNDLDMLISSFNIGKKCSFIFKVLRFCRLYVESYDVKECAISLHQKITKSIKTNSI